MDKCPKCDKAVYEAESAFAGRALVNEQCPTIWDYVNTVKQSEASLHSWYCVMFCELRLPAWAVGSYSIGPPAGGIFHNTWAGEFYITHSRKYHEWRYTPECRDKRSNNDMLSWLGRSILFMLIVIVNYPGWTLHSRGFAQLSIHSVFFIGDSLKMSLECLINVSIICLGLTSLKVSLSKTK